MLLRVSKINAKRIESLESAKSIYEIRQAMSAVTGDLSLILSAEQTFLFKNISILNFLHFGYLSIQESIFFRQPSTIYIDENGSEIRLLKHKDELEVSVKKGVEVLATERVKILNFIEDFSICYIHAIDFLLEVNRHLLDNDNFVYYFRGMLEVFRIKKAKLTAHQ